MALLFAIIAPIQLKVIAPIIAPITSMAMGSYYTLLLHLLFAIIRSYYSLLLFISFPIILYYGRVSATEKWEHQRSGGSVHMSTAIWNPDHLA